MKEQPKGILTLIGAILMFLVIGAPYIWGNISVYVTSYLRHYESDLTLEDTFIVLPVSVA